MEEYTSTNSPKKDGEVIVTFLTENFLAGSKLDVGQYALDKKVTKSYSIPVEAYEDLSKYNVKDNGFETVKLSDDLWGNLEPIFEESSKLSYNVKVNNSFIDKSQEVIDKLINWMHDFYSNRFEIKKEDITVVSSRNIVLRAAGCSQKSCNIPANPLIHLDYIDFDKTYNRQCLDKEKYKHKTRCPEKKQLLDVINIWFPTTQDIKDWPLGFIPLELTDIPDYIPIQLVSDSYAASMRYKDNVRIVYKKNMKQKEAYVFRSATDSNDIINKKGVMHSSFRITDDNHLRKSAELRFLIFRNNKTIKNSSHTQLSAGGGNRKKTHKNKKIKLS
jgi:hypothetical protein